MKRKTITMFMLALLALTVAITLFGCDNEQVPDCFVVFNTGEGATQIQTQKIKKGETAARPADPFKPQAFFIGWECSYFNSEEDFFSAPVESNIVFTAVWSDVFSTEHFNFKIQNTNVYLQSLTQSGKLQQTLEIPQAVKGHTITNLGDFLNGNSVIEKVVVPSGVKAITNHAFSGNAYIKTIQLSEGIESILSGSFADCPMLENVNIPSTVSYLGSAFLGTPIVNSAPTGVVYLDGWAVAFNGNTNSLISFNEGTVGIAQNVASALQMDNVSEIYLPASVKYFCGLSNLGNLNTITLNENNQNFKIENGALLSKDGQTFYLLFSFSQGGQYVVPNGVKNIASYAIEGKRFNITCLTFPASIQSAENYSVLDSSDESALTAIKFVSSIPPSVDFYAAFANIRKLNTIYIPEGSLPSYSSASVFASLNLNNFNLPYTDMFVEY